MIVLQVPSTTWLIQVLRDDVDLRARAMEWRGVAIPHDGAEYVPLKTDWMPNGDDLQSTPSGARVHLAGRWPAEVQAQIGAGGGVRVSPAAFREIWDVVKTAPEFVEMNGRPVPREMADRIRDSLCVLVLHDLDALVGTDLMAPFMGTRFSMAPDAARFWVFCPGFEGRTTVANPATGQEIGLFQRTDELPRVCSDVEGEEVREVAIGDLWFILNDIASCGLSEGNGNETENRAQIEAPEVAQKPVAARDVGDDIVLSDTSVLHKAEDGGSVGGACDPGDPADSEIGGGKNPVAGPTPVVESRAPAVPLRLIDGWPWSRVVTAIREWAKVYPDPVPDPNDISEAEARSLLRTMLQHPDVIAEERRRAAEAIVREGEYRDARVRQYAINVGVALPDPVPPPATQEFDVTDDGNGDRLVAQYRDSIRFCKTFDAWFLWDGSRWERDETCRMLALAKRVARTIHIEASATTDDRREKVGKWALSSGMLSRLKAMIACACPAVAVTPDEFDAHPTLLNCRNGTLELDTLTFREARREDLLTKVSGVAYDPIATCPTWLRHLQTIFAGDEEIVEGFQQMCGYSLLGSNPEEVMFILWGRGKNGKSVTVKALAHVLGDYAVSLGAESLMVQRGGGARPDLAKLKGVRMAAASEVDEGAKLAENIVKQYTSSNDTVSVRRLYENEFEFTPTAKIWLATNHEPQIRGTDDGIWRRIWMLPFTVQIAEEQRDPNMIDKLTAEAAGILNWMIEGLRKYHANGSRLTPPARVIAATRRYRMESDSLGRAIDEELVCGDAARGRIIARKELTNSLRQWFAEQDEKMPGPRMVAKALRERGVADGPVQGGVRYWIHARWKTDEEQEDDGIGR